MKGSQKSALEIEGTMSELGWLYPLDKELPLDAMCERVQELSSALHAIRNYQKPDPSFSLHVLVKDNIGVAGFPTSAGCRALEKLNLPEAECIARLRGNVDVFGKTHMSELAGFVTTVNSLKAYSELGGFGVNPHGEEFPPGGSSSGSAISVAAGLCDVALGTETRGSLMFPGLFCGVYSFKPTRGAISRDGIIPLACSFDTPGILGRNLEDIEFLFGLMKGYDPKDPLTEMAGMVSLEDVEIKKPLRVGLLTDPAIKTSLFSDVLGKLDRKDIEFKRIKMPYFANDYDSIVSVEFKRDLTAFLQKHATGDMPKSFEELLQYYRSHPESHPYGMNRLERAEMNEMVVDDDFEELVLRNILRANELIQNVLRVSGVDVLASETFLDWWSIGGGPTITVPLGVEANGKPRGLMLGLPPYKDKALLESAKIFVDSYKASEEQP